MGNVPWDGLNRKVPAVESNEIKGTLVDGYSSICSTKKKKKVKTGYKLCHVHS